MIGIQICQNLDIKGVQGDILSMADRKLHSEIKAEAGALLEVLEASGWQVSASVYEATFTGDWIVDLCRGEKCIRLAKEHELFTLRMLDDVEPESGGGARRYDSFPAFQEAVTQWARTPKSSPRDSA